MAASRSTALKLFKDMMKEAVKFSSYNFRMYALRRVRDGFRTNASLSDEVKIKEQLQFGKDNLEMLKRQTIIGNLYRSDKLIIEKHHTHDPQERSVK